MNKRRVYSDKMNAEDKENQCFEAQESTVKTPLKQTATSSWLLAEIQPAASGHLTTPPRQNEISPGDPWTPTANLKMLISAASPEIRNREQEKRLSDSRNETLEDHYSGDEYEKSQRSRKEKSLGLLCHKFLARYPCYPNASKHNEICLDEVAEELNVERRRIYDIMNVLESLHMVSRCAKNRYAWHGRHNLKKTLQLLKKVAEENKYTQQMELIKKRDYEGELEGQSQKTELLVVKHGSPNDHEDICFVALPGMEFRAASVNGRKDKSLRVMSQKFVMLFLVSTPQVVNLEVAAKLLISEDHAEYLDKSKFKTKIRRLYDIANVLSSLELIKKVHVTEERGRKPAFKWTGPDIFSDIQDTQPIFTVTAAHPVEGTSSKEHCSKNLFPTRSKKGFTRHPSLKLGKDIRSDRRKIRSAPSSPIKKNTRQMPSNFPNKMAQLAAICKQQLDDEQSREFNKLKMELGYSALPCSLESPSKSVLNVKQLASPSCIEILPLIHNSASPAMLPPIHSGMPCAVYLHPPHTQIVTAYNPGFTVQPVPCASIAGTKSPAAAVSNGMPVKTLVEDKSSHLGEGDTNAQDRKLWVPKEQDGTKNNLTSEKCFKRCKALLEGSPTKKCRGEDVELQNVFLEKCVKNEKHRSSTTFHLGQKILTPAVKEEKRKYGNTGLPLERQPEQQKEQDLSDGDRALTTKGMPAAFAEPTSKTWFPSGYLIPLAQCTKLNSETTLSNKENAKMCPSEQTTSSSPVAGGAPVTSEFTAVNFSAFHLTPLNLMLPLTSIATVPVVNGTALATVAPINSIQAPSSSNPSFTLQHLGLIPASMQMSANPMLGAALICQGAEHVTCAPKSLVLKQGEALQNIFPGHGLNRKFISATCLQQTIGHEASKIFQEGNENVFQMPGELSTISGSCSSSPESNCADRAFRGTLSVPQKKLDESTEDKS